MKGEDTLPQAVEERWYGEPTHNTTDEGEPRRLYGDPQHEPDPSDGPEALFQPWSADEAGDGDDSDGSDGSGDRLRQSTTELSISSAGFRRAADD